MLIVISLSVMLAACGGKATDPLGVVHAVKVGMSPADVAAVVDVDHFQTQDSYLKVPLYDFEILEEGFTYKVSTEATAPFTGELFFAVDAQTEVAIVVSTTGATQAVVGVGLIPFETAKKHENP